MPVGKAAWTRGDRLAEPRELLFRRRSGQITGTVCANDFEEDLFQGKIGSARREGFFAWARRWGSATDAGAEFLNRTLGNKLASVDDANVRA
jgi:hypothetical protein